MTRVWPALWPPWKRTTRSARLASQSTTLPLPSSPHWAPITATLAMGLFLLAQGDGLAVPENMGAAQRPRRIGGREGADRGEAGRAQRRQRRLRRAERD